MAKLNSKATDNNDSVSKPQHDEVASTSKDTHKNITEKCYNMNDLNPIDFNSADEVRQTMKAVLAGRIPESFNQEIINCSHNKQTVAESTKITTSCAKNIQKLNEDADKCSKPLRPYFEERKRRQPPKARPLKKIRIVSNSSIYLERFRNKREADTDFSTESSESLN